MNRWRRATTQRRWYGAVVALLLVTVLGMQSGALARLQATLDSPSPATGTAGIIAQGVSELPFDPIAWRIVRDSAEPLDDAQSVERALGFVVADPDGVHVVDDTAGTQQRLAPGEASFVPESAVQRRASLNDDNASYLRIALVAEGDANDAGEDELVFGGQGFAAPEGRRDIDLLRDVLDEDDESSIAGGDYPVLIMALSGSIEIDTGDEPIELAAGEATQVSGDITVRGLEDGSSFIAGIIGPEVPVPPRTSGTIAVGLYQCEAGITAEDLGDPIDADVAKSCGPVEDDVSATLTTPDGDELTAADAVVINEDTSAWIGLPFGDYVVNAPSGSSDAVFADADGNQLGSGDVTIDQDVPDVHVDVYLFQEGAGSITATVYNCPEDWNPDGSDPAECELTTEGFDITLYHYGGTSEVQDSLTLTDAESADGSFTWSGLGLSDDPNTLADGHYVIEQTTLPDGYNAYVIYGATLQGAESGSDYVNLTVDAPDAEITIYNWNEEDPTGTITLDAIECPTVDSGLQDCARTNGPSGITGIYIQDIDGAYDPLTESNATQESGGPFVWANVPLASYYMDTTGLLPPDGYQIVSVVLTPDGADIASGFTLSEDLRIANIVVVLAPVTDGNETGGDDTDNDGLGDDDETIAGTDPNNPDSDGDCHADGPEVSAGTNPLDSSSFPDGDCDMIESTEEN